MKAYVAIRAQPVYRRDAFMRGVQNAGYSLARSERELAKGDLYIIWNRYGGWHDRATELERHGVRVIVAENGYLGREWRNGYWYAMSLGYHNGAGKWNEGDNNRWDSLDIRLDPWRESGEHILILPQRGIGCDGVAQPGGWANKTLNALEKRTQRKVIVKPHPGEQGQSPLPNADSLDDYLFNAHAAVVWASSAGLKAIMKGIPCFHGLENWIGAPAATRIDSDLEIPYTGDRFPMLRRMIWAMWELSEIESGYAFDHLLRGPE